MTAVEILQRSRKHVERHGATAGNSSDWRMALCPRGLVHFYGHTSRAVLDAAFYPTPALKAIRALDKASPVTDAPRVAPHKPGAKVEAFIRSIERGGYGHGPSVKQAQLEVIDKAIALCA